RALYSRLVAVTSVVVKLLSTVLDMRAFQYEPMSSENGRSKSTSQPEGTSVVAVLAMVAVTVTLPGPAGAVANDTCRAPRGPSVVVQVKPLSSQAPALSLATTATPNRPIAVGLPEMAPVARLTDRPGGRPMAWEVSGRPAESVAVTVRAAGRPAMVVWSVGAVIVTAPGAPRCRAVTPSGVPRPVGPSYPVPAVHRYRWVQMPSPTWPVLPDVMSNS